MKGGKGNAATGKSKVISTGKLGSAPKGGGKSSGGGGGGGGSAKAGKAR